MCIADCKNYPIFNYYGLEPFYCTVHKQPNMFDVRNRCCFLYCKRKTTHNLKHCTEHRRLINNVRARAIYESRKTNYENVYIDDFEFDTSVFCGSLSCSDYKVRLYVDNAIK